MICEEEILNTEMLYYIHVPVNVVLYTCTRICFCTVVIDSCTVNGI